MSLILNASLLNSAGCIFNLTYFQNITYTVSDKKGSILFLFITSSKSHEFWFCFHC